MSEEYKNWERGEKNEQRGKKEIISEREQNEKREVKRFERVMEKWERWERERESAQALKVKEKVACWCTDTNSDVKVTFSWTDNCDEKINCFKTYLVVYHKDLSFTFIFCRNALDFGLVLISWWFVSQELYFAFSLFIEHVLA